MIPRLELDVSPEDRAVLERRSRSRSSKAAVAFRATILLLRADGLSKLETAGKLGTSEPTVQKWTNRYRIMGLAGLDDAKGRGRKPSIAPGVRERIVTGATQPPAGLARHSTRSMAKAAGVSQSTVLRTWRGAGIKPHLVRTFKVSRDPDFRAKFWDVIGLYLDPPEKAVVFCCDEKTQCQALERTQPGLPLGIGHIRTRTHDYTRNGTTNLFAALECATDKIIHNHYRKLTHREWLAFLKEIWHETPNGVSIEIIADNYATHKHPKVRAWLGKHPRIHVHYIPTSSSWLNLAERFFCEITREYIREGSFRPSPSWKRQTTHSSWPATPSPSPSSGTRRGTKSWQSSTGSGKPLAYRNWRRRRLHLAKRNAIKVKLFLNQHTRRGSASAPCRFANVWQIRPVFTVIP